MQLRPRVLWGLALCVLTGCQSYYPHGYGYNGPYSQFPTGTYGGTYVPPTTSGGTGGAGNTSYPTRVEGKDSLHTDPADSNEGAGSRAVPTYKTPQGAPKDLGTPASDDVDDSIKTRGTGNRGGTGNSGGSSAGEVTDDAGEALSSIDDRKFVSPVEFRSESLPENDREPRRLKARSNPSPYKKDPLGYAWLRGVVSRDRKSGAWQLTYNRDSAEDDPYEGVLTLAEDEALDILKEGDVILVEGHLDRSIPDRFQKPSYRVANLKGPLQPVGN